MIQRLLAKIRKIWAAKVLLLILKGDRLMVVTRNDLT